MHERFIPDPTAVQPSTWEDKKWIVVPNYTLGEVVFLYAFYAGLTLQLCKKEFNCCQTLG